MNPPLHSAVCMAGRAGLRTRPHLFMDQGRWLCRNINTTGFGFSVRGACNDWNAQLTGRHSQGLHHVRPT